ncbi:MAG: zinc ribbon domain-containing protein [Gemmatimonadota bacterium]
MSDLERFMRRLVELLQARASGSLHAPLGLGELRTSVMPYRANRSALRLATVEDYDTVVLRVVAEEGDFVRTLPPESAHRCRAELASPNPDLGLLERLAATTIQVGASALARILTIEDDVAPGPDMVAPGPSASAPTPLSDLPMIDTSETASRPPPPPPPPPSLAVAPAPPPPRAERSEEPAVPPVSPAPVMRPPEPAVVPAAIPLTGRCRSCREPLPAGKRVMFCPYCGNRLEPTICPVCHTEVETGWRHCITCGAPVGGGPALA